MKYRRYDGENNLTFSIVSYKNLCSHINTTCKLHVQDILATEHDRAIQSGKALLSTSFWRSDDRSNEFQTVSDDRSSETV